MAIAFFDMDRTLLSRSSGALYVQYLWRRRMISVRELIGVMVVSAQYALNTLDFTKAMAKLSTAVRGGDAAEIKRMCDQWVEEDVLGYIAPAALTRLREHERAGDYVLILSASTQFAVEPVARYLKVPYRCTELEIENGKFTGRLVGEPCFGAGKLHWATRIAAERGATLKECTFYTDSYSDRALLDAVGKPMATNPDFLLRRYARQKGWPIVRFY
jgi:putative phosphoserine phosphatase/1-acylglycerol-3-phosphate O-acyltransferase